MADSKDRDTEDTKIWPDDYSDEELREGAVDDIVEGVYEGASLDYCVEYQTDWLDQQSVAYDAERLKERARERLEEAGVDA